MVVVTSKGAVLVVDATTGEPRDTLAPPGSADGTHKPSRAPGGTIYFSKQGVDCGYPTLFEVPLDGSREPRRLGNGGAPAVSPDGTRLAYFTPSNGCIGATLVVRNLATGKEQRWEAPESDGYFSNGAITAIAWAPDGRRLAFQFDWEGSGVYLLDTGVPGRLDTARPVEPKRQPDNTSLALRGWHPIDGRLAVAALCCLSPDGMTSTEVHDRTRTFLVDPATGESTDLHRAGEAAFSMDYDGSGQWMLWISEDGFLRVRDPRGGERSVRQGYASATW
jgi:Tol biopolymer transport system component